MRPADSRISVVITSYNQKEYLIEAVESVLNQTVYPFEILIGDDCSTDGSREIIEEYAHRHLGLIRPFYHKQNLGRAGNRNFAIERLRGNLVTVLDGDDRFLPKKLQMELEALREHPEASIVYSNVYYIDQDGQRIGLRAGKDTTQPSGYIFHDVFGRSFPHDGTIRNELIAYPCLLQVGLYDGRFAFFEDWDLRIRLTRRFRVAYCHEPLIEYRRHPGSLSTKTTASVYLTDMKDVYSKNRHLLDDLPRSERVIIKKRLSTKLALLAEGAAREAAQRGDKKLMIKYWLEYSRYDRNGLALKLWQRAYARLSSYI